MNVFIIQLTDYFHLQFLFSYMGLFSVGQDAQKQPLGTVREGICMLGALSVAQSTVPKHLKALISITEVTPHCRDFFFDSPTNPEKKT